MHELKLMDVQKKYKDKEAVRKFNYTFTNGVYGLLGENGAGKTTLMRLICGVLQPTGGSIYCDNIEIASMGAEYRRLLGYLPQDFGYYGDFTAERFLRYMAALKALPEDYADSRIDELLDMVELKNVKKKKLKTFSGGMIRRIGIAQALLNNPEILILDEPMNGLDPIGIYEMREYLVNLCKEGNTTVFISSHILSEIEQIADVIGVMNHGRLLEEESITDLHKRLRRYAEYEVSNVEYVFSLLKERLDVSEILIDGKNRIRLFGKEMHRIEEINSYLIQNNIPIRQIRIEEENLEDYFSELIGGGEIE